MSWINYTDCMFSKSRTLVVDVLEGTFAISKACLVTLHYCCFVRCVFS